MTARSVVRLVLVVGVLAASGCSSKGSSPTAPGGGTTKNPTIYVSSDSTRLIVGYTSLIHVTASDPNGYQLTFGYACDSGSVVASGPTATTATYTPSTTRGLRHVTVTASNDHGGQASATATIYVLTVWPNVKFRQATNGMCRGIAMTSLTDTLTVLQAFWCDGDPDRDPHTALDPGFLVPGPLNPGQEGMFYFSPCTGTAPSYFYFVDVAMPQPDGRRFRIEWVL